MSITREGMTTSTTSLRQHFNGHIGHDSSVSVDCDREITSTKARFVRDRLFARFPRTFTEQRVNEMVLQKVARGPSGNLAPFISCAVALGIYPRTLDCLRLIMSPTVCIEPQALLDFLESVQAPLEIENDYVLKELARNALLMGHRVVFRTVVSRFVPPSFMPATISGLVEEIQAAPCECTRAVVVSGRTLFGFLPSTTHNPLMTEFAVWAMRNGHISDPTMVLKRTRPELLNAVYTEAVRACFAQSTHPQFASTAAAAAAALRSVGSCDFVFSSEDDGPTTAMRLLLRVVWDSAARPTQIYTRIAARRRLLPLRETDLRAIVAMYNLRVHLKADSNRIVLWPAHDQRLPPRPGPVVPLPPRPSVLIVEFAWFGQLTLEKDSCLDGGLVWWI